MTTPASTEASPIRVRSSRHQFAIWEIGCLLPAIHFALFRQWCSPASTGTGCHALEELIRQLRRQINALERDITQLDFLRNRLDTWLADWEAVLGSLQRAELLEEAQQELERYHQATAPGSEVDRTLERLAQELERVPELTFQELCSQIENQFQEALECELLRFGRFVGGVAIPDNLGRSLLEAVLAGAETPSEQHHQPTGWDELREGFPHAPIPKFHQLPHVWPVRDRLATCWREELDLRWERLGFLPEPPRLPEGTSGSVVVGEVHQRLESFFARNSLQSASRLHLDRDSYTITLDGHSFTNIRPVPFLIFQALWNARPIGLSSPELEQLPGLRGKHFDREIKRLPQELQDLLQSEPGSRRWIRLPCRVVANCP